MKRFTETEKWRDPWFRKLSPSLKCLWQYLCDNCDHAGVINPDWELISFQIGENVDVKALLKFSDRVEKVNSESIRIVSFIPFQYGNLSEDCQPHQAVFAALRKHGINPENISKVRQNKAPTQVNQAVIYIDVEDLPVMNASNEYVTDSVSGLPNRASDTLQDQDKDKDKDQEAEPYAKKRERNPLFDALCDFEGIPLAEVGAAGGRIGKALAEIRSITPAVTSEEIARRGKNYETHFRGAAKTASALAKHWGKSHEPTSSCLGTRKMSFA